MATFGWDEESETDAGLDAYNVSGEETSTHGGTNELEQVLERGFTRREKDIQEVNTVPQEKWEKEFELRERWSENERQDPRGDDEQVRSIEGEVREALAVTKQTLRVWLRQADQLLNDDSQRDGYNHIQYILDHVKSLMKKYDRLSEVGILPHYKSGITRERDKILSVFQTWATEVYEGNIKVNVAIDTLADVEKRLSELKFHEWVVIPTEDEEGKVVRVATGPESVETNHLRTPQPSYASELPPINSTHYVYPSSLLAASKELNEYSTIWADLRENFNLRSGTHSDPFTASSYSKDKNLFQAEKGSRVGTTDTEPTSVGDSIDISYDMSAPNPFKDVEKFPNQMWLDHLVKLSEMTLSDDNENGANQGSVSANKESMLVNRSSNISLPSMDHDGIEPLQTLHDLRYIGLAPALQIQTPIPQVFPLAEIRKENRSDTSQIRRAPRISALTKTMSFLRNVFDGMVRPPLKPGEHRLVLHCACGRRIPGDYTELRPGGLHELRRLLKRIEKRQNPVLQAHEVRGTGVIRKLALFCFWSIKSAFASNRIERDMEQQTRSDNNNNAAQMQQVSQNQPANDNHLLLVLPYMRRGKRVQQPVCTSIQSDREFFEMLGDQYRSRKGAFSGYWSLKTVREMHFVNFSLLRSDHARVHKQNVVPPESMRNVTYAYENAPWSPPIDSGHLVHLMEHPWIAEPDDYLLKWVPKKLREKLVCPRESASDGWGIEYTEGWDTGRGCALIFVAALASILFGILWSVLRNDISGGFTAGGTLFVVVTSGIGSLETLFASPGGEQTST